jgi:hypothetical protein
MLLALAVAAGPAAPVDLTGLERALDAAVRRVSRARFAHVLGMGEACRSYRVPGYGAVVVLAPRVLPASDFVLTFSAPARQAALLDRAIRALEDAMKTAPPEMRAPMEKRADELRAMKQRLAPRRLGRARPAAGASPPDPVQEMEQHFRALELEAERMRQVTERMFDELERRMREGGPHEEGPPARVYPLATPTPDVPPVQAAATEAEPLAPAPQSPPWVAWFESEGPEVATPESVVSEVRVALVETLAQRGAELRGLAAGEHVVVAVDFYPRGAFGAGERPARTLVLKVRVGDLAAPAADAGASAERAKKIEVVEY